MSRAEIFFVYGYPLILVVGGGLVLIAHRSSLRRARIRAARSAARADEKALTSEEYQAMLDGVNRPSVYKKPGRLAG